MRERPEPDENVLNSQAFAYINICAGRDATSAKLPAVLPQPACRLTSQAGYHMDLE